LEPSALELATAAFMGDSQSVVGPFPDLPSLTKRFCPEFGNTFNLPSSFGSRQLMATRGASFVSTWTSRIHLNFGPSNRRGGDQHHSGAERRSDSRYPRVGTNLSVASHNGRGDRRELRAPLVTGVREQAHALAVARHSS
jgi:hypothetical protein